MTRSAAVAKNPATGTLVRLRSQRALDDSCSPLGLSGSGLSHQRQDERRNRGIHHSRQSHWHCNAPTCAGKRAPQGERMHPGVSMSEFRVPPEKPNAAAGTS
jgi:hypothetical protein